MSRDRQARDEYLASIGMRRDPATNPAFVAARAAVNRTLTLRGRAERAPLRDRASDRRAALARAEEREGIVLGAGGLAEVLTRLGRPDAAEACAAAMVLATTLEAYLRATFVLDDGKGGADGSAS